MMPILQIIKLLNKAKNPFNKEKNIPKTLERLPNSKPPI